MKAVDYSVPWGRKGERYTQKLEAIEDRLKHTEHLQKVQSILQQTGYTTLPAGSSYDREFMTKKQMQLRHDRQAEIDYANRKLAERIAEQADRSYYHVDDRLCASSGILKTKTLNAPFRKREEERIALENRSYNDRLRGLKGTYSRNDFEKEAIKQEKLLENLSHRHMHSLALSPGKAARRRAMEESMSSKEIANPLLASLGTQIVQLASVKQIQQLTATKLPGIRKAVSTMGNSEESVTDPAQYLSPASYSPPQRKLRSLSPRRSPRRPAPSSSSPSNSLSDNPYATILQLSQKDAAVPPLISEKKLKMEQKVEVLNSRKASGWHGIPEESSKEKLGETPSLGFETRSRLVAEEEDSTSRESAAGSRKVPLTNSLEKQNPTRSSVSAKDEFRASLAKSRQSMDRNDRKELVSRIAKNFVEGVLSKFSMY